METGSGQRDGSAARAGTAAHAEAVPAGEQPAPEDLHGTLHHVEVWVPDLARAEASFGPLLEALGHRLFQSWPCGRSWRRGTSYLVLEESPDLLGRSHERRRPGLNHLAFHVRDAAAVEELVALAQRHGWRLLFPERHPHAGGPAQYAAYLENADGFEVELVALTTDARRS